MLIINPFIEVVLLVLNLFQWSLIIYILISLLTQFGIVNPYHSIINLIQNSLKFAKKGTEITFVFGPDKILLKDQGPGIPKSQTIM